MTGFVAEPIRRVAWQFVRRTKVVVNVGSPGPYWNGHRKHTTQCVKADAAGLAYPVAGGTSPETVSLPHGTGKASPRVLQVAEQILTLSLIEMSELKAILQERLNISDAMLSGPTAAVQAPEPAALADEEEEVQTKTSYTLHLKSFEDGKKVALIKEIRNIMPDMNLVQAKKFVESLPHVVLENVGKDEAEKVMTHLETLGGVCLLE